MSIEMLCIKKKFPWAPFLVLQCFWIHYLVFQCTRARGIVPLQWNNLARQRQIQYLQSVSNKINKKNAGLNECAPSNPSD